MSQNAFRTRPSRSFGGGRPSSSGFGGSRPSAFHSGGSSRRSSGGNRRGPLKQTLHFSKFIKPAITVAADVYVPLHTFSDFGLDPAIVRNITAKGFTTPTPIQDQTIPAIMNGKDVVGLANTGTGKTAAFGLPLLHKLLHDGTQNALIMAPTRELAQQIEAECRSYLQGQQLSMATLIGGSPMMPQIRSLQRKPALVIGTPGRIKDHFERGNLPLQFFNNVVLDEVDRMLDMGFINDIRFLLGELSPTRHSLFFSATMDPKIESLIQSFSVEPVVISAKTGDTSDNVHQDVVRVGIGENKIEKLHDILLGEGVGKVLIFDETKRSVDKLTTELERRGFSADSMHGNKTQGQRRRALDRFKRNEVTILVATDVAARGIDVADITHVINYSQPNTYDDYVHRIGRAGRAGRAGKALTFVS